MQMEDKAEERSALLYKRSTSSRCDLKYKKSSEIEGNVTA